MSVLWVVGFGSFTLASLVVGARLVALAVGTRRMFRPAERWPGAVVAGIGAVLATSSAIRLAYVQVVPPP